MDGDFCLRFIEYVDFRGASGSLGGIVDQNKFFGGSFDAF
jgi:hypothetical protein